MNKIKFYQGMKFSDVNLGVGENYDQVFEFMKPEMVSWLAKEVSSRLILAEPIVLSVDVLKDFSTSNLGTQKFEVEINIHIDSPVFRQISVYIKDSKSKMFRLFDPAIIKRDASSTRPEWLFFTDVEETPEQPVPNPVVAIKIPETTPEVKIPTPPPAPFPAPTKPQLPTELTKPLQGTAEVRKLVALAGTPETSKVPAKENRSDSGLNGDVLNHPLSLSQKSLDLVSNVEAELSERAQDFLSNMETLNPDAEVACRLMGVHPSIYNTIKAGGKLSDARWEALEFLLETKLKEAVQGKLVRSAPKPALVEPPVPSYPAFPAEVSQMLVQSHKGFDPDTREKMNLRILEEMEKLKQFSVSTVANAIGVDPTVFYRLKHAPKTTSLTLEMYELIWKGLTELDVSKLVRSPVAVAQESKPSLFQQVNLLIEKLRPLTDRDIADLIGEFPAIVAYIRKQEYTRISVPSLERYVKILSELAEVEDPKEEVRRIRAEAEEKANKSVVVPTAPQTFIAPKPEPKKEPKPSKVKDLKDLKKVQGLVLESVYRDTEIRIPHISKEDVEAAKVYMKAKKFDLNTLRRMFYLTNRQRFSVLSTNPAEISKLTGIHMNIANRIFNYANPVPSEDLVAHDIYLKRIAHILEEVEKLKA